jgi:hypothetical protein
MGGSVRVRTHTHLGSPQYRCLPQNPGCCAGVFIGHGGPTARASIVSPLTM